MSEPKQLWFRLGCSLQLDDVEARFLLGEPHPYDSSAIQKIIRKLLFDGRVYFCGDCVIRPEDIEAFNLEYGTDYPEEEVAFYL